MIHAFDEVFKSSWVTTTLPVYLLFEERFTIFNMLHLYLWVNKVCLGRFFIIMFILYRVIFGVSRVIFGAYKSFLLVCQAKQGRGGPKEGHPATQGSRGSWLPVRNGTAGTRNAGLKRTPPRGGGVLTGCPEGRVTS